MPCTSSSRSPWPAPRTPGYRDIGVTRSQSECHATARENPRFSSGRFGRAARARARDARSMGQGETVVGGGYDLTAEPLLRPRRRPIGPLGPRDDVERLGHAASSAISARAAPLRYARRRWISTTGIVTRFPETRSSLQASRAQLLVHAALRQEGQAEAGLNHPLLRRQAVDRDDLRRAQPPGGQTILERPGIRLVERAVARGKRDPPLAAERRRRDAPARGPAGGAASRPTIIASSWTATREHLGVRVAAVAQPERRVASAHEHAHLLAERRPEPQLDPRVRVAEALQAAGQASCSRGFRRAPG